ncbi:MAG: hypothetical protein P8R42_01670 [Candidatus Binatia bacterium]|nr:hypothetical protein [Candidatus Binatia bacterium]
MLLSENRQPPGNPAHLTPTRQRGQSRLKLGIQHIERVGPGPEVTRQNDDR